MLCFRYVHSLWRGGNSKEIEKGLPYWNQLWGDMMTFFSDGKRKEVKKIQSDHMCERTHASWQEKKMFFMDKD